MGLMEMFYEGSVGVQRVLQESHRALWGFVRVV